MNSRDIVQKAIAAGVLPSDALSRPTVEATQPWPLVVMSFLGSLLAAVPVTSAEAGPAAPTPFSVGC